MNCKKIGIFGQLASAKDTIANYLVRRLNETEFNQSLVDITPDDKLWKRIGFADAVKHVFMRSFDVTWDFIEEWKRKDEVPPTFDLTVRKGLQQIGDGFRKIQGDVWIRTALRNKTNMVISDGRYLNEAKMVKEHNGINILLWRPGFENNDPNPSESQIKPYVDFCAKNYKNGPILFDIDNWIENGVSELKYFDYFLVNDGDLQDLYDKIDKDILPFLKNKEQNEQQSNSIS